MSLGCGLIFFFMAAGCQSQPQEKAVFSQQDVEFFKTNEQARNIEDLRCKELAKAEFDLDEKCLAVKEANRQLLTKNYNFKGKAPKKLTELP